MNTRYQLVLDKKIARPVAYLLNFVVRLAGQLLRINHSLDKEFKTIAVCKFKGMGSIIQATPMLAAIKSKYPNVELIFVSTKGNKAILSKIDSIDTLVTIDDSSLFSFAISNLKSLLFLIKKRPEVYIDLEIYSDFSTLFTLFSLSVNRIGFYLRSSSFRMGMYTHMMFFNPKVPISKVYLQMAHLIGCGVENTELIPLSKTIHKPFEHVRKYIVINPNSSDLRLERRWAAKNFIELINRMLIALPEYDILLIGSKTEQDYTESIVDIFKDERVQNLAGKTSIDEAITVINNATAMITNDTGPMHLAFALNTPVVCLFGPCSPEQYGMSKNATIIYKNTYCSPCVHDFEIAPCNGNNICMQLISVEEVYNELLHLLSADKSRIKNSSNPIFSVDSEVLGIVQRQH